MAAVMQRAANIDENNINVEQEHLTKLVIENKVRQSKSNYMWKICIFFCTFQGLRELLEISRKFGSQENKILKDEKSTQTQLDDETDSIS